MKKLISCFFLLLFLFFGTSAFAQETDQTDEMLILESSDDLVPEFVAQYLFCEDPDCGVEKKNFVVGEPFFLSYKSELKIPVFAEIRSMKNDEIEKVRIPGFYTFKNEGEYIVSYKLLVDGFQDIDYKKNILVTNNNKETVCVINGVCGPKETLKNCPQDCNVKKVVKNQQSLMMYGFLISVFILILIVLGIFVFMHNKKKEF